MPSEPSRVAALNEPCTPSEIDTPCAGIGRELRCRLDAVSTAPLPGRLADLFAALEASCAASRRR